MSSSRNKSSLEIDEDIQQQQKVWVIERIAWVAMVFIVLAALGGLLGHGPLSSSTLDDPDSGLLIQYERFERMNAQTLFRIQMQSQQSPSRLSLGEEFLSKVELISVEPDPVAVEAAPDHFTYVFALADTAGPSPIVIHYKPLEFGSVEVEVGLDSHPVQVFSQFVYP